MQKLSTGILQSSMYNLKPLKRINTNARLSIKIDAMLIALFQCSNDIVNNSHATTTHKNGMAYCCHWPYNGQMPLLTIKLFGA